MINFQKFIQSRTDSWKLRFLNMEAKERFITRFNNLEEDYGLTIVKNEPEEPTMVVHGDKSVISSLISNNLTLPASSFVGMVVLTVPCAIVLSTC